MKLISLKQYTPEGYEKILINAEHISSISPNKVLNYEHLTVVQVFNNTFAVKESIEDIIKILGK